MTTRTTATISAELAHAEDDWANAIGRAALLRSLGIDVNDRRRVAAREWIRLCRADADTLIVELNVAS